MESTLGTVIVQSFADYAKKNDPIGKDLDHRSDPIGMDHNSTHGAPPPLATHSAFPHPLPETLHGV